MRSVSVVLILVVAAMASAAPASDKPYYDVRNTKALFKDFIKKYDRKYKDEADKEEHYQAFVKNLKLINKSNAETNGVIFDINKFADYTEKEMKNLFGLNRPKN